MSRTYALLKFYKFDVYKIRNSNIETRNKSKILMTKFEALFFLIVSYFEFRASDLDLSTLLRPLSHRGGSDFRD